MRSIEWEKTNETMPGLQSGVLSQPILATRLWLGVPRRIRQTTRTEGAGIAAGDGGGGVRGRSTNSGRPMTSNREEQADRLRTLLQDIRKPKDTLHGRTQIDDSLQWGSL